MKSSLTRLSWQTGVLTFRNMSLSHLKQTLEERYGTEVLLYFSKQNNWRSFWNTKVEQLGAIRDEIKLVLYMYYDANSLAVRGILLDEDQPKPAVG